MKFVMIFSLLLLIPSVASATCGVQRIVRNYSTNYYVPQVQKIVQRVEVYRVPQRVIQFVEVPNLTIIETPTEKIILSNGQVFQGIPITQQVIIIEEVRY